MGAESTPTLHNLPFRAADFATLPDALDYAAKGDTGANFYTGRGKLYAAMPYAELRDASRVLARKLLGMGLQKGDRVALVAETNPDFLRFFFACQYAGLIPVSLPASVNLGGHTVYVTQLRGLLESSMASIAMAPEGYASFLEEAGEGLGLKLIGSPAVFDALPEVDVEFQPVQPSDVAYIQYTSGSTRFPRGVVIEQGAVMSNLAGIILSWRDALALAIVASPGCRFTMTWAWLVWCWCRLLHRFLSITSIPVSSPCVLASG